jgi:hypothetical protein
MREAAIVVMLILLLVGGCATEALRPKPLGISAEVSIR